MSVKAIYLSLCPTNIVWINKTNFTNMNIHHLQREKRGSVRVNKETANFHLLPRLENHVPNAQKNDAAWRPSS